jgi:integrase/recombinase XerC
MSHYANSISRPPKSLTELEQRTLLRVTGEHVRGFRDHVIISFALGTGLRAHELAALDVGDVFYPGGRPHRHLVLRIFKRSAKKSSPLQEVIVSASRRRVATSR